MRCSLRKCIKVAVFGCILMFSIIFYLHNFEKSLTEEGRTFVREQHGGPVDPLLDTELSRKQRNAMSVETIKDDQEKEKIQSIRTTVKPRDKRTELEDIFIAIKTTKKYHANRLKLLLDTWIALAKEEVTKLIISLGLNIFS